MKNKKFSRPVAKMITDAKNNATWFKEDGWGNRDELGLTNLIPLPPGKDFGHISIYAHAISNSHGRISFAQFIGSEPYDVNLLDCWIAGCLAAKFSEQSSLQCALKAECPSKLGGIRLISSSSEIINLAIDLWKLYSTGNTKLIEEFIPLFEVYEIRGDSTRLEEKYRMPTDIAICVTSLIGRGDGTLTTVCRLLDPIPVFEGVALFWEDDELFARWTEKAARWHLDYCPKHYSELDQFASIPPDVLIPSWITALDRFRQIKNKRPSCLGSHELFEISKAVFDGAKNQNHTRLPSLIKAEKYYKELFGTEPLNTLPFWEEFLQRE
jgi:hypothetical protein